MCRNPTFSHIVLRTRCDRIKVPILSQSWPVVIVMQKRRLMPSLNKVRVFSFFIRSSVHSISIKQKHDLNIANVAQPPILIKVLENCEKGQTLRANQIFQDYHPWPAIEKRLCSMTLLTCLHFRGPYQYSFQKHRIQKILPMDTALIIQFYCGLFHNQSQKMYRRPQVSSSLR